MNLLKQSGTASGLEQLRGWIASGQQPAIGETLKFALVEVSEGRAVFAGTPGPHAYNPIGSVHGGYSATLLDSACGCAVHSALSSDQAYTTLELKIAYHRGLSVDTGPVRAEGKVVSIGKRVAFAEARITDEAGRLYASATSTLLIFERKA
ncbi:PaaI family thioesterase [Nevskia sp.]|uniref:PaaI family thioesterase n=1 Tax=Nevskia sp. TaxID=1929292 RepID=UPI0025F3475B|nr:PaaI family thioesterase [Nevskia sp.]